MPLCLGTGVEAVVHSLLLFDEERRIIKAYASDRFLTRLPGEPVFASLILAGEDADQEGALAVVERARSDVNMIEFEPWRVKSWGLDEAIEEAWKQYRAEERGGPA
jgi:hypothetical protein